MTSVMGLPLLTMRAPQQSTRRTPTTGRTPNSATVLQPRAAAASAVLARKSRAAAWSRFQFVRDLGCAFGLVGCGSPAPLGRCESGLLGSGSALAGGRWGLGFAPRGALPERPGLEALSLAMAFLLGPLDTISGL